MYSKMAKYKCIFDYDLPLEIIKEIAEQHYVREHYNEDSIIADYYWMPKSKILWVVIDGKNVAYRSGYHKDVDSWDWENMEKVL